MGKKPHPWVSLRLCIQPLILPSGKIVNPSFVEIEQKAKKDFAEFW